MAKSKKQKCVPVYTVCSDFTFEAAHRLLGHKGLCRFLHGHTYKVRVGFVSTELDELGMVVDFSQIKLMAKGWLDQHWDHATILNEKDPLLDVIQNQRFFKMDSNPTAEKMAQWLFLAFTEIFGGLKVRCSFVTVWETPTNSATIEFRSLTR